MASKERTQVLLVDDQKLFIGSLRYVLESRAPDLEIVGIAENGIEAVELTRIHHPDIILMDVRMPEMDGVQATRLIHQMFPAIRILMLSTFDDDTYVRQALSHGAIGYLIKDIEPSEVINAIRGVMNGIMQISPNAARRIIGSEKKDDVSDPIFVEPLTRREKEVLLLIMKSYDNRQIAVHLNVSEQTARNYVHNLYSKLGVSNRMQLLAAVKQLDLTSDMD